MPMTTRQLNRLFRMSRRPALQNLDRRIGHRNARLGGNMSAPDFSDLVDHSLVV
jgi:hypothetical protein